MKLTWHCFSLSFTDSCSACTIQLSRFTPRIPQGRTSLYHRFFALSTAFPIFLRLFSAANSAAFRVSPSSGEVYTNRSLPSCQARFFRFRVNPQPSLSGCRPLRPNRSTRATKHIVPDSDPLCQAPVLRFRVRQMLNSRAVPHSDRTGPPRQRGI